MGNDVVVSLQNVFSGGTISQQTQNICIAFVQRRPNVFDVGLTLYKLLTSRKSHFHTLMTPSRELVTTKHWAVWQMFTSVMISWWPAGGASGPRRGMSSVAAGRGLPYVSCTTSVPSIRRDLHQHNNSFYVSNSHLSN